MPQLSAIVITRNEAANIGECLDSLAFCDERIVVDCGSTDLTVDIAREKGARVEFHEWLGFGPQKKSRCSRSRPATWVLSFDRCRRARHARACGCDQGGDRRGRRRRLGVSAALQLLPPPDAPFRLVSRLRAAAVSPRQGPVSMTLSSTRRVTRRSWSSGCGRRLSTIRWRCARGRAFAHGPLFDLEGADDPRIRAECIILHGHWPRIGFFYSDLRAASRVSRRARRVPGCDSQCRDQLLSVYESLACDAPAPGRYGQLIGAMTPVSLSCRQLRLRPPIELSGRTSVLARNRSAATSAIWSRSGGKRT